MCRTLSTSDAYALAVPLHSSVGRKAYVRATEKTDLDDDNMCERQQVSKWASEQTKAAIYCLFAE